MFSTTVNLVNFLNKEPCTIESCILVYFFNISPGLQVFYINFTQYVDAKTIIGIP